MSLQGALGATDNGAVTFSIAPTSRSGLFYAGWIDTLAGYPSFAPEVWMDLDANGAAPLLAAVSDNTPQVVTETDNQDNGSAVSYTGLAASWMTRSNELLGPHNGAFQTLRTGVNTTVNAATTRFQNNTAAVYTKLNIIALPGGGRFMGGRVLNLAVVTGAYDDTQADQMRAWTKVYWADTWPAPYSGFVKWSRRLSVNGTTGFGSGDVTIAGTAFYSATGDPAITAFGAGGGGPIVSITAAV